MRKRLGIVALVVTIAAVVGVVLWKRGSDGDAAKKPAAAATTTGSASVGAATKSDALQPARVTVVVSGAQGPLVGATVRMSRASGDVLTVQTGKDGTAQSEPLEPGTWTFSASADGHEPGAAAPRELAAGETVRIELTLVAGGRVLSGLVTDVMGGPIAGARIDAAKLAGMARPGDAVASTLTGADGKYSLSVAEGQLLVAASEASYAPQSRYVDVGPSGATASFQLVPGGVIEGVVLDEKSRTPIANAQVLARRDAAAMPLGERSRLTATTGSDGRFRLAGLRPGGYNLAARAAGSISRSPTTIGLGVAEQITDVEILVAGAPSIRGIVVDEKGAPVADLDIDAFSPGRGGGEIDTKSDAKGAFVLEGMQPGRYVLLARGPNHLPAGATRVEVDTKDVDGVKVTVRAGNKLAGRVEPRQVCEVTVEGDDERPMLMTFIPPQMTKADGVFSLGPVDAGAVTLEARCPSGAQGTKQVTVAPGMAELVVEVKPGASIAGRVVDGNGKAVAAVTVMGSPIGGTERTTIVNGMVTSGIHTLTNASGDFELRGLAPGSYRLGVLERGRPLPSKGDEPVVAVAAAEKKTGVTVEVDRPDGVIRGVVTGPDGKPLAEAWVSLHVGVEDLLEGRMNRRNAGGSRMVRVESTGDGEQGAMAPVLTDAAGKFEVTGLARIPMTVVAEADGGKLRGQAMRVVPDASITIQALGLTELRGVVRASAPLTWFNVSLEGPTREQRGFASADGTFAFGRVDPGQYKVVVTSNAGNGEAQVTVSPGQPATVEVTLVGNAFVVGKLVDAGGKPVTGLPVAVIPDPGDGPMRISIEGPPVTSNPDGTFRIEAKAGSSALVVLGGQGPAATRKGLVLEPGKTTDVGTVTVGESGPPEPP